MRDVIFFDTAVLMFKREFTMSAPLIGESPEFGTFCLPGLANWSATPRAVPEHHAGTNKLVYEMQRIFWSSASAWTKSE